MRAAIESLRARDIGVQQVTGEDFRLRSFAVVDAAALRDEILDGRGFVVIDGVDSGRFATEDLKLIYWAVGNALGEVLPQNLAGDRMCTVADLGYDPDDANVRKSMTDREIGMHTDTVVFADIDIVGLLCVVQADTGGESRLISATTIYEHIRSRDSVGPGTARPRLPDRPAHGVHGGAGSDRRGTDPGQE